MEQVKSHTHWSKPETHQSSAFSFFFSVEAEAEAEASQQKELDGVTALSVIH